MSKYFFYNFIFLAGSLCLTCLAFSSFGSDRFKQEETQEQIRAAATTPQIAIPFSPESTPPHDVRVHILSFLTKQNDLLRTGAVSKSWRKAAEKVWEKRTLDLSGKHLTEADYKLLARGIFPRLRLNNVELNDIGALILSTCSHLRALELKSNNLHATPALVALLSLPLLTQINLGYNSISDKDIRAIAQAVKGRTSITKLYLTHNYLGDEGAKVLAETLEELTSITKLSLPYNQIGDEGAKALGSALKGMTSITTLDLSANQIGDEGAKALGSALKDMTSITKLDLDHNQIEEEGATALGSALKGMMSLTTLSLESNQIGEEGIRVLEDLKESNPSLELYYN